MPAALNHSEGRENGNTACRRTRGASYRAFRLEEAFPKDGVQIFEKARKASKTSEDAREKAELFEQIGRLKMENEWLKKKLGALT